MYFKTMLVKIVHIKKALHIKPGKKKEKVKFFNVMKRFEGREPILHSCSLQWAPHPEIIHGEIHRHQKQMQATRLVTNLQQSYILPCCDKTLSNSRM